MISSPNMHTYHMFVLKKLRSFIYLLLNRFYRR